MAKTITLNVRVSVTGDGLNHQYVFQSVNAAGPQSLDLTTVAGFNGPWAAGTFGDNMLGAVVVPPTSTSGYPTVSGVSKTLKGVSGDTGIPLDPNSVAVIITPSGGGGFGLTYGGAEELFLLFV